MLFRDLHGGWTLHISEACVYPSRNAAVMASQACDCSAFIDQLIQWR